MNAEKIIEAFSTASRKVIGEMTRSEVTLETPSPKECSHSYDYSVIIGVTGTFKGVVSMSFQQETALLLLPRMMGKRAPKELNENAESTFRELANMAVSKALIAAAEEKPFDITPPIFVKGHDICCSVDNAGKCFATRFHTSGGVLEFNISMSD